VPKKTQQKSRLEAFTAAGGKLEARRRDNSPRCQHIKRDGKQCNAVATGGFSVCRLHGAGTRARPGGRPPVHGRYSKSIPQALRGKLEAAMNDPALLELRPEIGLIGVRIEELLEGLQEHSVNIKAAQKAFQKMRGAMADGDALEAQLQITALGGISTLPGLKCVRCRRNAGCSWNRSAKDSWRNSNS
jgi:hypothetical protein